MVLFFFYFPIKVAGENPRPPALNDNPDNDLHVKKKALIDSAEYVSDEVLTISLTKFSTLTEMKLDDIRELAATVFSKSCVLDPLPSSIIKQCTDLLLPTITNIVNLSLREG